MIPANNIEPIVGASTCTKGNQVWKGNIGTLIAKERKKASQRKAKRIEIPEIEIN